MRASRVFSTLVLALVLPSCTETAEERNFESAEYKAEREAMRREVAPIRASMIGDLYHEWDDVRASEAGIIPRDHADWSEDMDWLRRHLGACEAPEAVSARGRDSHGRFRYPCENGALEVELWIDYGLIGRAYYGARGLEAPEPVRAAAEEVVAAFPLGDAELDRWPAGDQFTGDFARGLGRCAIRDTDIVSIRGGLFYLHCEGGPAHFKIGLGRDGEPSVLRLCPPLDEKYRYLGADVDRV